MLKRLFPCVALFCLVAPALQARAEDAATMPPVVLRVQPVDGLLSHIKHIAGLVDQGDQVKQFEENLNKLKAFDAIDAKLPLGAYATLDGNPAENVVGLIPVKDEQAFVALLGKFELKAEKGEDGVYSITAKNIPVPLYMRVVNKYAYVAMKKDTITKAKLYDPAKVLGGDSTAVASLSLRIDEIPENVKLLLINQLDQQLAKEKDKKEPGETELEHKLKGALIDAIGKEIASTLKDSRELVVRRQHQ